MAPKLPRISEGGRRPPAEEGDDMPHIPDPARRPVDLAVLSDLHLGTYGCHAEALLAYLRGIDPRVLVLNGDVIDFWQLKRRPYWPEAHTEVLREVLSLSRRGRKVYYLTGNHDDALRRYSGLSLGNLHLRDKLLLELDGRRVWIFHGDVFDLSLLHARWIARWGGVGYDVLLQINRLANRALVALGRRPYSLARRVKQSVKQAVKFVGDFETTATDLAMEQGYDVVVCGHIHVPQDRVVEREGTAVRYLNCGDWMESLTCIEYSRGIWSLHHADADALSPGLAAGTAPLTGQQVARTALQLVACEAVDERLLTA